MPIDLTEVRKVFHTVFETDKKSKWREILSRRVPLRIGSMSDSFMWMDQKYKVSLEFLKILKFYRYPYIVFTRSDLIAEEEYLEAIDSRLASIQFSISGDNEVITRQIEPGAPSFSRRIQALRRLADAGIWTTVRINPLFPTYPDGYFTAKASVQERFDGEIPKFPLLDISQADKFMSQLASAKVPSIVVGFVRLNQTAISQLSKATNVDLRKFFYPDNYRSSGESRYSDAEIGHYYNLLRQSSQKYSIRFSTCYIGNGIKDYFQYQQLWTQKKDCCDAVGNVEAFTQTAQSVTWEERTRHASCKETVNVAKKQENQFDQIFSGEKERISAEKTSSSSYSSLGKPFKWQGRNRESSFQD
ncbi:MAG: hypothetical protein COV44_08935 [Deltaproteobacteria bacterium CG11_big_fil_rev_8_21_14_0_20_45_16]|nr:MAG: hypothetical protein COV44_08935 [Deltaproteobacteria bacterium CG11_big_fil_rev_8_21_14_0_20_45_16]